MTNIEAYKAKRERMRTQNNYPPAPLWRYMGDCYLMPRVPDPDLGGCQPYRSETLTVQNGENSGAQMLQVILDEDPSSDPSVVALRRAIKEWKALRASYIQKIAQEYKRLVAQCKVVKYYWHAGQAKPKWRKPWYRRVWVGWKWVNAKEYLKPRVIAYRRFVRFNANGKKVWSIEHKTIRPFRWVMRRKPKFKYELVRPGALVMKKTRVADERRVTDWPTVRRRLAAYKIGLLEMRLKALDLRQTVIRLRRKVNARPKLGASWTTSGFVPMPTISLSVHIPYLAQNPWMSIQDAKIRFPGAYYHGELLYEALFYAWDAWGIAESQEQLLQLLEARGYVEPMTRYSSVVESEQVNMGLGDRAETSLIPESQATLERATVRSEKTLAAYASLVSLTKASDYQFQIVRSIGELKDTRDTFKQARDFLKWLVHPKLRGLTPKKVYAGLAGAYLAWKFAIEPTIQDVQTVVDNTVEYLTDIRRRLRELMQDLQGGSSIYHARNAYASANGLISGRKLLHADNETFGEFHYSLSWTRRYNHAVPICSDELYATGASQCDIESLGARGAQLVQDTWASGFPASYDITDEADDGRKVRYTGLRRVYEQHGVSPSIDYKEEADAFALHAQQLHQLPVPYDIRDVATGVLFAAYHAGDLLQLASKGGLDLGAITMFMDQSLAMATWLKNQDAQRAAVSELMRHSDLEFVAWQLTPLSFIYDWFTTSGTIVEALNSLKRMDREVLPQPLYGVWQSERHELMSVVPNLRLKERRVRELVREWSIVHVSRRDGCSQWLAAPTWSTIYNDFVWEPSPGTAVYSRTGLYRFRRGDYQPDQQVSSYLPRLRINLDAGKLVTLSAMLGGFV